MANYKNSLGESELFVRMTAGFAKVCESVQSGKFVRNEMGVICESVCEDDDERVSMFGDDDVFIGRNDEYYNYDPDNDPVFTPAYWTYSVDGADDECFAKEGPVFKLTDEGKMDFEEWWDAEQVGTDLCYGRFKDEKFGKKHLSREQEWEYLTDPKNGLAVEVTGKVEEDDVVTDGNTQDADVASATPEQINGSVDEGEKLTKGAVDAVVKSGSDNALTNSGDAPDGWTVLDAEGETVVDFGTLDDVVAGAIEKGVEFDVDEDMLPKFRKWYDALKEAKVVDEGIVGQTLGTIGGATVGSAIGGALGCPVAGGIAGGIAGASLTEGCDGKKKPMKKLIPEGCCGGKAKKVLKEAYEGETNTVNGVLKSLKASDPSDELLIRDGRHHELYPQSFDSKLKDGKSGRPAYNVLYVKSVDGNRMTVGTIVDALKTSKVPEQDLIICDMENKRTYRVIFTDRKVMAKGHSCTYIELTLKSGVEESVNEEVQKLCKTCGNPLDETGTCQDCQGYSPVKEGEGEIKFQIPAELKRKAALKANAQANKKKVAQAIRDGKAVGIVKEGEEKKKVTVKYCFEVSDPDKKIINPLTYVGKIAGGGHSFDITVDAGSKDYGKTFVIDGDGADRINKIEIIEVDEDGNETVRKAETEEEDK